MLKKGCLISLIILLAGCSTWNNFRAYYNTYYNAKKSFNVGLQQVQNQPVRIDPNQLIHMYPAPLTAGNEQFEEAIDNGAQILRRFSETKWTDDALLLMGKAYYYQQDFFSALQKFETLLAFAGQTYLKQEAILWKGRTLLDISAYREGVNFLQERLTQLDENVNNSYRARLQVLLGEYLARLGNLESAANTLLPAITNLDNNDLQGRSYFLLGQLFLRLNEFDKAYQAFTNVAPNFPDYEYIYWAEIKAADAARSAGRITIANAIYQDLLNDADYEQRNPVYFRLALASVQDGNYEEGERLFKQVLANSTPSGSAELRAETYYQLAQLYSGHHQNYTIAAAYYDSSAANAQPAANDLNLETENYGRYISLKAEISRIDSLLRLGSLSPTAFDSVLTVVRQKRQEILRRNLPINQPTDNTLTNITLGDARNEAQITYSSAYGFLNYRNPQLVASGIRRFQAVWGGRPLVDRWRRIEAVSTVSLTQNRDREDTGVNGIEKIAQTDAQLGINLSEIPFTLEDRAIIRTQKAAMQYQLGNLFFLTLEQPDSASHYYRQIVEQTHNAELIPRALYSLYQLHGLEQQADSAAFYRKAIVSGYPNSIYAQRISRDNIQTDIITPTDSTAALRKKLQELLNEAGSTTIQERANELRALALKNQESVLAPYIFYQSIRAYIQSAKQKSTLQQDSLRQNDINQFLYTGPAWNRVRELIKTFQELFPQAAKMEQINTWQNVLNTERSTASDMLTCGQTGIEPEIVGGMNSFINKIEIPENLQNMNVSGTLTYRLIINRQGVVEAKELLSNPTNLGIEEVYEEAIETVLRFEPINYNGIAAVVSCEFSFPIRQ